MMPTPTPPFQYHHLPTHLLHRPPAQITLLQPRPPAIHTYLSHDPSIPPSQILRLYHLRTMLLTTASRKSSARQAQIETDSLRAELLSLPSGSYAWPTSRLRAEWGVEQTLSPNFAAQAWKEAREMMDAIARDGLDVVVRGGSEREKEVCGDGEQLAMVFYLRGRYRRLEWVAREVRWIEKRAQMLWEREKGRLRAWVKMRGAEGRGGRRLAALRGVQELGERLGLGIETMAEAADAYRWGEALRRRTVKGEMDAAEWPSPAAFEVYKWRRYEAREQGHRAVSWRSPAYRTGMWFRGGSPLKKVSTVRSISLDSDSENQGKKRKREESDHGLRRTSPVARDRKHM